MKHFLGKVYTSFYHITSLPPASERWWKVMFSLCPPLGGGGVLPPSCQQGRGGVLHPRSRLGGGMAGGLPHPKVWMEEHYPPPHTGLDRVPPRAPHPRLDGVPPSPHQETHQHSEHLLRGGRYASCVHAGELSCSRYRSNSNWLYVCCLETKCLNSNHIYVRYPSLYLDGNTLISIVLNIRWILQFKLLSLKM